MSIWRGHLARARVRIREIPVRALHWVRVGRLQGAAFATEWVENLEREADARVERNRAQAAD